MCEVKREYYKTGELKSECFELNQNLFVYIYA